MSCFLMGAWESGRAQAGETSSRNGDSWSRGERRDRSQILAASPGTVSVPRILPPVCPPCSMFLKNHGDTSAQGIRAFAGEREASRALLSVYRPLLPTSGGQPQACILQISLWHQHLLAPGRSSAPGPDLGPLWALTHSILPQPHEVPLSLFHR